LLLFALVALGGLIWANIQYAQQNPGGNDFIPRWLGTRLYIMEGQSPYSEDTTQAIQQYIYDRPARAGEDQSLFVYPFYSFVVFIPFAVFEDYAVARGVLMAVMEVALLAIVGLGINLARWKISPWMLGLMLLFAALWYHSLHPLINANPAVLAALFIMVALWAIREQHDILAGFMLVLATMKPNMVVLVIPFILYWTLTQRRFMPLTAFFGILTLVIAASLLLLPSWPLDFIRQIIAYPDYTLPGSPGAIFKAWLPGIGSQLGWVLTAVLGVLLVIEWTQAAGKDFRWFYWTACLTLVITNLIGIRTSVANYIALLPAVLLVFAIWIERWRLLGRFLTAISILGLSVGLWWLSLSTLQIGVQPVQHPVMFFPLPIFLLIGLYWVRFWATSATRPLLDEIRSTMI